MHQLLTTDGKLVGLLFNKALELGPPFGGSKKDYELLFANNFHFLTMDLCYNSIQARSNTELFIELQKKTE